jgi:hypothetical protein
MEYQHIAGPHSTQGIFPYKAGAGRLEETVRFLANEIGPRNIYHYENLQRAAAYLIERFRDAGYQPEPLTYKTRGRMFANIEAEVSGTERPEEVVILGAHYDTHKHSPGANDNGSAVAVLLELAQHFAESRPARTLRFVAFTNEEKPFTHRSDMGSRIYARARRRKHEKLVAMICLETLGCYSKNPGSQKASFGGHILPKTGDFLALVANPLSNQLLDTVGDILREERSSFKFETLTAPTHLPLAWSSDHWSFWMENYPALMLTDTAPLRYSHYHKASDTPDKLDFEWLWEVCESVKVVLQHLTSSTVPLALPNPRPFLRNPSTMVLLAAALGGAAYLGQKLLRSSKS